MTRRSCLLGFGVFQRKVRSPKVREHLDVDRVGIQPRVHISVPLIRAHYKRYSVKEYFVCMLLGGALAQHDRRAAGLENLPVGKDQLLITFIKDDAAVAPPVELLAAS